MNNVQHLRGSSNRIAAYRNPLSVATFSAAVNLTEPSNVVQYKFNSRRDGSIARMPSAEAEIVDSACSFVEQVLVLILVNAPYFLSSTLYDR